MRNPLEQNYCSVDDCTEYLEYLKDELATLYASFLGMHLPDDIDEFLTKALSDTLFQVEREDEITEYEEFEEFWDELPSERSCLVYSKSWFLDNYAEQLLSDQGIDLPDWVIVDWGETNRNLLDDFKDVCFQMDDFVVEYY